MPRRNRNVGPSRARYSAIDWHALLAELQRRHQLRFARTNERPQR